MVLWLLWGEIGDGLVAINSFWYSSNARSTCASSAGMVTLSSCLLSDSPVWSMQFMKKSSRPVFDAGLSSALALVLIFLSFHAVLAAFNWLSIADRTMRRSPLGTYAFHSEDAGAAFSVPAGGGRVVSWLIVWFGIACYWLLVVLFCLCCYCGAVQCDANG